MEGICPDCRKEAPLVRVSGTNDFVYRCACGNETGVVVRYRHARPDELSQSKGSRP